VLSGVDIPIGKAVRGVVGYVLDEQLNVVERGSEGELCCGGVMVARGYLNDKANTDAKFIEHATLGRLYRTGDLVNRRTTIIIETYLNHFSL
jgi:non-ribosomal peptide synthetase component F